MKHHTKQEHRQACIMKHDAEADEPLESYAAAGKHGIDDKEPVQQAETKRPTEQ